MLICIHLKLPRFRLIPRWNQTATSGSSRIGIKLSFQAHPALDNSRTCSAGERSMTIREGTAGTRTTPKGGTSRCSTSQKHNAHGPEIIQVHYPFHPLYGQTLRVQRRVKFPRGEYLYCELPDGTIGAFPAWMADVARSADFTVGPPLASTAALADLRALLDRLHSCPKRDTASLTQVLQEGTNGS